MNSFFKIYCRLYQSCFRLIMPFFPYRVPEIIHHTEEAADVLKENGISSVLLVTDKIMRKSDAFLALEHKIAKYGIQMAIYDETCPNPTIDNVKAATTLYREKKCRALIAFGGGSSIDCAKAVGAAAVYPKKDICKMQGLLKVLRKLPLLIAIPTTAGTGSEVTVTAVITDAVKKQKYTMNNFTMIPSHAALDPSVTYTLPPHLTATTGMDALTHAVEAYIGHSTTKETRTLALETVRLIFRSIEIAYADGYNENARTDMLLAAHKAGIAFTRSYVGYVHAVAHTLGGQYGIPHGLANAVLLPIVLEAYGTCIHEKLRDLAIAAGIANETDTPMDAAAAFILSIKRLNERMNIPKTLDGIQKTDIPVMAKHAAKEANPLYPVPRLMDASALAQFYFKVMT